MLAAFSFKAKPGREREFESLLNNPDSARAVAKAMGATRNALFLKNGRMIRILDIPEGSKPVSLAEVAKRDPRVADFLRKLGPLIEDGFDYDRPETLEAFNQRITFSTAYDVRV
ncbi:MAG: hypothetical protein E6K16_05025 [Methanobacteriota archaeon]|nr:MAG: hypothetical protein E6K16_05025 [Euryarchaeota archaeon]